MSDALEFGHLLRGELQLLSDLLDRWIASEFLHQHTLRPGEFVDRLHHVDGNPDGARLVGEGSGDGLADPPGGVGGELETLPVVELLDGTDQTKVSLLNEVEQDEAAPYIFLGDGNDEAEVGLDEPLASPVRLAYGSFQDEPLIGRQQIHDVQLLVGTGAGLGLHRKLNLLLRREQREASDLLEVHPNRVRDMDELVAGQGGGGQGIVAVLADGDLGLTQGDEHLVETVGGSVGIFQFLEHL